MTAAMTADTSAPSGPAEHTGPEIQQGSSTFTPAERDTLHRVMAARRDVRHFRPGGVISDEVRARLMQSLHTAPSVGLMQPWRFVRVSAPARREAIAALVEAERLRTAEALGERGQAFLALKVEGIRDCAEIWVTFLAPDDGTVFGRRTLSQEMAWCSVGCAIQNLWLAARAENLGLGWVSMFEPRALSQLLALPAGAQPVGVLCLGPVDEFYSRPMLELEDWRHRRPMQDFFLDDTPSA
jgi:5,6-dimethylbenzimidazole synthase